MMVPVPVTVMIMKMEHHADGGGDVDCYRIPALW